MSGDVMTIKKRRIAGFTLIELLVVIAIIAILAVVVVLVLNPAQLLAQSRDSNRVSDLATISTALGIYQSDQVSGMGTSGLVYASVPDAAATSTAGSDCGTMGMPSMIAGYAWHCAASSTYRNTSSNGWIPVAFSSIAAGAPFGSIPVDPVNNTSSLLFYTYSTNGTQYELTASMESDKYKVGGSGDVITGDGAALTTVYAKGTDLALEPLDYGGGGVNLSLVGYWSLNEGTGTTAYDGSGNNATGTWSGTGPYYGSGVNQTYAGNFTGSDKVALPRTIQDDFTITAWFKTTTLGGNGQWYSGRQIVSAEVGGVTNDFGTAINGSGQIMFGIGNPDTTITGSTDFADGNWHFMAATRAESTGNIVLYVDGAVQATGTVGNKGSLTAPPNLDIATDPANGSYFVGSIEKVRTYSRVLSATEIRTLFNKGI